MKNLLFFVISFLSTISLVVAQPLPFGIKAGVNSSMFDGYIGTRFKYGANFGFFMKLPLAKRIFFRSEVYYSSQGRRINEYNYQRQIEIITNLNYLTVPFMFEFGRVVSFQGGPQIGYLLSAREAGSIQGSTVDINLKKIMKPYDLSVALGVNVNVGETASIGLRYNNGLTEIFMPDYVYKGGSKNYVFSLYAGLLIKSTNPKVEKKERFDAQGVLKSSPFSFGFKGGLNLDNTSYKSPPNGFVDPGQNSIGAHLGMYFRFRLGKKISLTPELQYIHKQSNSKSVEIPIVLAYSINNLLEVEVGPQSGILIDSGQEHLGSFIKSYSLVDYGLNGGARFHISKSMALVCRYYHGIQQIVSVYPSVSRSAYGYNRNLQFSVYFKLGKQKNKSTSGSDTRGPLRSGVSCLRDSV